MVKATVKGVGIGTPLGRFCISQEQLETHNTLGEERKSSILQYATGYNGSDMSSGNNGPDINHGGTAGYGSVSADV